MDWKDKFWQWMMYLGAITILIWALLKTFGIINTPISIEMIPYYATGISLLGISYKAGKIIRTVETTEKRLDKLENEILKK